MATWQANNILSGTPELAKYGLYDVTELWVASLTTALASADIINGPTIPSGSYVTDLVVDVDQLDTGTTVAFEVGYVQNGTTTAAAFIASGNTTARAGGIAFPNVAGTYGFTNATYNSVLQMKMTAAAATAKAGSVRFKLTYNYNP